MKRMKVLFLALLALLTISASLFAAAPTITVDGLAHDWAGLEPVAVSDTGETKLYAFIADGQLFVLVTGPMGDWNDIQINSDGQDATGHQSWIWPNMGSDFLLEDGLLFKSTGADWAWEELTEIPYATTGEGAERIIEMSLDLTLLGLTGTESVKIGFAGGGIHVPKQGDKPVLLSPVQ